MMRSYLQGIALIGSLACTGVPDKPETEPPAEKQDANQPPTAASKAKLNETCSGYNCADGLVCWQGACARSCEADADCPTTFKGTKSPVCSDKVCTLPCETAADCPPSLLCRRVPGRVLRGGVMYPPVTACIATNFGVDSVTGEP